MSDVDSSETFVGVEWLQGDQGVALVRLDRPKMNALSRQLLGQLRDVAEGLSQDPPGAVVFWGGERIFAAGADITEFGGPEEAAAVAASFHEALDAVAAIPRATIAAISGYALGGGCELAMACDFRIAADNARLGQPEVLLGIIPGGGGTQRLTRLVGPARSKEIIFSGRMIEVEEALRIGLVDRTVPAAELLASALEWARSFASGAVVAQGMAKRAIDAASAPDGAAGMSLERELFAEVAGTEDAAIGVRSFLENGPGKARFVGR